MFKSLFNAYKGECEKRSKKSLCKQVVYYLQIHGSYVSGTVYLVDKSI